MPLVEIVPGRLWQCGIADAAALTVGTEQWKTRGIRAVLCPAYNARLPYHEDLAVLALRIDDHDSVPPAVFDLAVAFHQACGPTLVHCHGGVNRSAVFAAAIGSTLGVYPFARVFTLLNAVPSGTLVASLERWLLTKGQP